MLSKLTRSQLSSSGDYIYNPVTKRISFEEGVEQLKNAGKKIVIASIDNKSPKIVQDIIDSSRQFGIHFKEYSIDLNGYRRYFKDAGYATRFSSYYPGHQIEKSLEHYVALSLLALQRDDVFMDIASENSPVPDIYRYLTGAKAYRQDITYKCGIDGNTIGGDACSIPVPNGFASKAALTCSLEHFEGDADTRLFIELSRVLKPGGKVCVVPLYIFLEEATQTDPTVSAPAGVIFDENTTVYCAKDWGNRHGRFYSPCSLNERIIKPVKDKFTFRFFHIKNADEVDPSVYARFAFCATRT